MSAKQFKAVSINASYVEEVENLLNAMAKEEYSLATQPLHIIDAKYLFIFESYDYVDLAMTPRDSYDVFENFNDLPGLVPDENGNLVAEEKE